uniref:Uncharacterized protein n=1 Tax=Vespula pensylvanica TaxID=30213 RepID=A0A834P5J1_VESPE|nr:hypothetical protein H0235_005916 [Vespula pensylvanica]
MWMILDGMVFLKVPKTRNTISRETRREKGSTFSVGVTLVLVYFGLIPRNCLEEDDEEEEEEEEDEEDEVETFPRWREIKERCKTQLLLTMPLMTQPVFLDISLLLSMLFDFTMNIERSSLAWCEDEDDDDDDDDDLLIRKAGTSLIGISRLEMKWKISESSKLGSPSSR